MNKSELFKSAHKLAKSVIKSGDNYRVTFGACIKAILDGFVAQAEKITLTLNKWTKKTGEVRVYLNKDNDDFGYLLVEAEKINFSKVEAKYAERVKAAVAARLAKLQKEDADYVEADVASMLILSI